MNSKELTQAIKKREHICGTALISTTPVWVDAMKSTGVDFVFIDTEHTPQNRFELAWLCKGYSLASIAPVVRIPEPNPYLACMALDAFAAGIMVPYVETLEQVKALVGAVKYRPLKGDMLQRALNGEKLSEEVLLFLAKWNEDKSLWINIESQTGIDNLEKMLDYGGIDAIIIGPHDLSINLGTPENYYSDEFFNGINSIVSLTKKYGVSVGCHNKLPLETRVEYNKMGMNISLYSSDVSSFSEKLSDEFSKLKKAIGENFLSSEKDIII